MKTTTATAIALAAIFVASTVVTTAIAAPGSKKEHKSEPLAGDHRPPSLCDRKVLFMYDAGTEIIQGLDGNLWFKKAPRPFHEENIRNYRKLRQPFETRKIRGFGDGREVLNVRFLMLDSTNRRWFRDSVAIGGKKALKWISKGKLYSRKSDYNYGGCNLHDMYCPVVDGLCGRDIMEDDSGRIWSIGLKHLWRFEKGNWTSIALPVPADPKEAYDLSRSGGKTPNYPFLANRLSRWGDHLWLIRSFYTNCYKAGSFLVHFHAQGKRGQIVFRTKDKYITGIIPDGPGFVFFIGGRRKKPDGTELIPPEEICRINYTQKWDLSDQTIHRKIADLGAGEWKIREAASKELKGLPPSRVDMLKDILKTEKLSLEQTSRLKDVIEGITSPGANVSRAHNISGFTAGRLVFVSRGRRWYIQPYRAGKPAAVILVTEGEGKFRKVVLRDPGFRFDLQGPDGTIYGHDEKYLYRLDRKDDSLLPILSLENFQADKLKLIAAKEGKLCFQVCGSGNSHFDEDLIFWVDPGRKSIQPPPPGKAIADGVWQEGLNQGHHPVAVGPDKGLWFLKYRREPINVGAVRGPRHRVRTQLWRTDEDGPRQLTGWVSTSFDPSIWPLKHNAAIVMTMSGNDGISGRFLYHDGEVFNEKLLKSIIEKHNKSLLKLVPDGAMFLAGHSHERAWFVRVGKSFYVKEEYYQRFSNGCGSIGSSGIYSGGGWKEYRRRNWGGSRAYEPIIGLPCGVDPARGRLLCFSNDYKTLMWKSMVNEGKDRLLITGETPFAWWWLNRTELPRLTSAWIMNERTVAQYHKMHEIKLAEAKKANRKDDFDDWDIEYRSSDFGGFRRWNGNKWDEYDGSFYGGYVWEDHSGCIWHLRLREASVRLPDGRKQVFPLDACTVDIARLAVESKDAVWIATQQSLWRFALRRDGKGKCESWRAARVFNLQGLGYDFHGPWIAGPYMYYLSRGKLYRAKLSDMVGASGGSGASPQNTK